MDSENMIGDPKIKSMKRDWNSCSNSLRKYQQGHLTIEWDFNTPCLFVILPLDITDSAVYNASQSEKVSEKVVYPIDAWVTREVGRTMVY